MSLPTVCAVCLTADRQALTDRAVRSFVAQDYVNAQLLIWDSGITPYELSSTDKRIVLVRDAPLVKGRKLTIGALRNEANRFAQGADIICHWDSDDWSATTRITEQVAVLKTWFPDATGYREMLFWDSIKGEAWRYSNSARKYILGTSLCYWRNVWAKKAFPGCSKGEDRAWIQGLPTLSFTSVSQFEKPLMIAEIHGDNTSSTIDTRSVNTDRSPMWSRVPEWDARIKEILETA